ncbi:MAG: endolytic transglycosylase MltG [Actinobacteria bacterium]|nr:endolytic transglycosylase MltG [Actinomycetota bacterium]
MRRLLVLAVVFAALAGTAVSAAAAPVTLKIIFKEGLSVRQMADTVSIVHGLAIRKRHVTPVLTGASYASAAAATSAPAAFRADDKRRSIEGFLFPAGYLFGASTRPSELIRLQLDAFATRWKRLDLSAARARHVSPYGVLTIASMVERETVAPSERKLVAAVICNRLAIKKPLAIDATLRYGLGIEGTRPITEAELRNQTPYNTSIRPGLPPTPIGNPGLPSMIAAAHPANLPYLYYVRKPDGVHHFFTASETEFCKKAAEYGYHC